MKSNDVMAHFFFSPNVCLSRENEQNLIISMLRKLLYKSKEAVETNNVKRAWSFDLKRQMSSE